MTTAVSAKSFWRSSDESSVVLPLPRNPVSRWTGSAAAMVVGLASA
jgi:hypothetical protein